MEDPDALEKLYIASAFHDLGLWTDNTVDYLPPSRELARAYLQKQGREDWITEVDLMIDMHHKIRPFTQPQWPMVEIFRVGDLADFSLGLLRGRIPGDVVQKVKAAFPNAGFHAFLIKKAVAWTVRHPLNPAPVFKW